MPVENEQSITTPPEIEISTLNESELTLVALVNESNQRMSMDLSELLDDIKRGLPIEAILELLIQNGELNDATVGEALSALSEWVLGEIDLETFDGTDIPEGSVLARLLEIADRAEVYGTFVGESILEVGSK